MKQDLIGGTEQALTHIKVSELSGPGRQQRLGNSVTEWYSNEPLVVFIL